MSKAINLNDKVSVRLTEHGLNQYLKKFPWRTREEVLNDKGWVKEQLYVLIESLNSFSMGSPNHNPFFEMVFDDNTLVDVTLDYEHPEIEKIAVETVDLWLGKHYANNVSRRASEKPGYIIVSVDIVQAIEFRPVGDGRYAVSNAFGTEYPDCETAPMTLDEVRHCMKCSVTDKINSK